MPRLSRRDLVITQLLDGFTSFNGDTITRTGESLRGTPGFAVSLPWTANGTGLPHRRFVGEWYDRVGADPFDAPTEAVALRVYLGRIGLRLPPALVFSFARHPRTYGAWRNDAGQLALAVSMVVAERREAETWGRAFSQLAIFDLLLNKQIRLDRPDDGLALVA